MDNSTPVHPQNMVTWDKPAWEFFIQTIGTMAVSPEHSWQALMAIRKNFKEFSPGCQKEALVAADRLILVVQEDMEQIMAILQDMHQDVYAAEHMEP